MYLVTVNIGLLAVAVPMLVALALVGLVLLVKWLADIWP